MRILLGFSLCCVLLFTACEEDENPMTDGLDYQAVIHEPTTDDKHVGHTMHIHVDFESRGGETVHHVNVRIYNKDTNEEIYNEPSEAHVHEEDGLYKYHDDLMLSADNGVSGHTNWVLEAKVWGHEAGIGEVLETREFHVHPQ